MPVVGAVSRPGADGVMTAFDRMKASAEAPGFTQPLIVTLFASVAG